MNYRFPMDASVFFLVEITKPEKGGVHFLADLAPGRMLMASRIRGGIGGSGFFLEEVVLS